MDIAHDFLGVSTLEIEKFEVVFPCQILIQRMGTEPNLVPMTLQCRSHRNDWMDVTHGSDRD